MVVSISVNVGAVSNVVPATPTLQPCWRFLSNLDFMLSGGTFTKQVYYYKPELVPKIPFSVLVSKLKESLSSALVHYYILAGRVQRGEDGRYQINCNDSGVPFREAQTEARFDDWEDMRECPIEDELNPPGDYITDYAQAPLVQVQVTQFGCGGIAIGYVVCEMVVDGYSSMQFMKSWSEVHKGLPISRPPLFIAELLKARNPPVVNVPIRDYIASAIPPKSTSINYKVIKTPSYEHRLFTITSDKIDALVREVEGGPYSYGRATSFEAMAALIWKSLTEARDLPDDATTKYVYPMSLRNNKSRWDPPIPSNYFGNAVHLACLPAKAGDIKSRHMSYAARLIHQDIMSITTETVKSAVDWMQIQLNNGLQVGFNCDFYSGTDVHNTSMYIFPIYDADFGWGRPLHYSLIMHPWFGDGVAFMLPTPEGGRNRQISVALPQAQMKKLMCSDTFLGFATLKKPF